MPDIQQSYGYCSRNYAKPHFKINVNKRKGHDISCFLQIQRCLIVYAIVLDGHKLNMVDPWISICGQKL